MPNGKGTVKKTRSERSKKDYLTLHFDDGSACDLRAAVVALAWADKQHHAMTVLGDSEAGVYALREYVCARAGDMYSALTLAMADFHASAAYCQGDKWAEWAAHDYRKWADEAKKESIPVLPVMETRPEDIIGTIERKLPSLKGRVFPECKLVLSVIKSMTMPKVELVKAVEINPMYTALANGLAGLELYRPNIAADSAPVTVPRSSVERVIL